MRRIDVRVHVLPEEELVATIARARDFFVLALRAVEVHGTPSVLHAAFLVWALDPGIWAAPLVLLEQPKLHLPLAMPAKDQTVFARCIVLM
jgi:hypothetical protein